MAPVSLITHVLPIDPVPARHPHARMCLTNPTSSCFQDYVMLSCATYSVCVGSTYALLILHAILVLTDAAVHIAGQSIIVFTVD